MLTDFSKNSKRNSAPATRARQREIKANNMRRMSHQMTLIYYHRHRNIERSYSRNGLNTHGPWPIDGQYKLCAVNRDGKKDFWSINYRMFVYFCEPLHNSHMFCLQTLLSPSIQNQAAIFIRKKAIQNKRQSRCHIVNALKQRQQRPARIHTVFVLTDSFARFGS